jgi:hypothetical protein
MAQTGELYNDPGPDFFHSLDPQRQQRRVRAILEAAGYQITKKAS